MMALASPTRSASASDLPILLPRARRKVFAIPPPTMSWSTRSASDAKIVSLVDTLEPATIATNGRLGASSAAPSASSSPAINGPAQATGAKRAMPSVVASALCAVPKASLAYTSQSAAIFFESASSFFFSPLLQRQFSKSTTSPGATLKPPSTQFAMRRTFWPRSSDKRFAIGASESSGFNSPSVGRPRCDVTMTAAPAFTANAMPGTDARMRVSSVIAPASSCGTLRSARMKTRLPARLRSVSFLKFIRKVPFQ